MHECHHDIRFCRVYAEIITNILPVLIKQVGKSSRKSIQKTCSENLRSTQKIIINKTI